MTPDSGSNGERSPKVAGAAAAGAGSGTIIAAIANNLSGDYWFKSWLIVAAPVVSVAISTGWLWCKAEWDKRQRRKEAEEGFAEMRKQLVEMIDGAASDDERDKLQQRLDDLQELMVSVNYERVRVRILRLRDD